MVHPHARGDHVSVPIDAIICDSEACWSQNWTHISPRLSRFHPVRATYLHQDILDASTWNSNLHHLTADLYTISYCLSEFCFASSRDDARHYFHELFTSAPRGAYFLFLDVLHSTVYNWFDQTVAECGLHVLADLTGTVYGRYDPYLAEPSEAAVAERGYRDSFGRPTPRTDLKAAYRLCVKP